MKEPRIIGPAPCPSCGGEYGEHTTDCPRHLEEKESSDRNALNLQMALKPTQEGWWWHRLGHPWDWTPRYVQYIGGCGPEWLECVSLMQSDKAGDWKGEWFGPIPTPSGLSSHAPKSSSATSVSSCKGCRRTDINEEGFCPECAQELVENAAAMSSSPSLPAIEGEKWTVNTAISQRSSMCSLSTSPKGTHWFFPKECVSNVQEIADNHNASLERVKKVLGE